jgi:small subunit ribosomal protein S17
MEKKKTTPEKTKKLVGTRGRFFKGQVTKKFATRVVIELERTVYVPKYERYYKKKTKLHAKLPESLDIQVGDMVKIQETRPQSKIIHFKVIDKISRGKE